MLAMAGLEDDCGSCSVGGMAVDLGLYPTVEQADDMAAVIAELQQKLAAANARVAELTKLLEKLLVESNLYKHECDEIASVLGIEYE